MPQPPKDIKMCERCYKSWDMESFFLKLRGVVKSISNANRGLCEAPCTVEDIEDAIKKMKINESGGR